MLVVDSDLLGKEFYEAVPYNNIFIYLYLDYCHDYGNQCCKRPVSLFHIDRL